MKIELRYYQREAINSIFDYFTKKDGNPLLALPTGTGKSILIAQFVKEVMNFYPKQRFLMLTHVKELIEQNAKTLYKVWSTAPLGIFSAGLKKKDVIMSIIFGGRDSIVNNIGALGHRDLLLIDECHLLSPKDDTSYHKIISGLKAINPKLKVIGFTATPFRLGQGMLTDGGLFTDICYDITSYKEFNRLIQEGFLAPLIPKRTDIELDVSSVGISNGDFKKNDLQIAVDKAEITQAALNELVAQGQDRRSWLIFASGVDHAEHIAETLIRMGVDCAAVHSKMPTDERDKRIKAFKRGELRAISNNNVLTTGFDHPPIDLIGMLRPTCSPGLWVQMLGRATRPCEGKENALVLDFAGNTRRLGPINDPLIPRKKGKETGDAPVKICEACGVYNHASVRFCDNCGAEFHFKVKITKRAGNDQLLKQDAPIIETFKVDRIIYQKHNKIGSITMRVNYYCGLQRFQEWVGLEHGGAFGKRARDWWRQRSVIEPPKSIDAALMVVSTLRVPKKINVHVNKQYPEILSYEF